jgi:pectinesterase
MIKMALTVVFFFLMGLTVVCGQAASVTGHFIVDKDGSGDFTSLQDAVMAVPDFRKKETVIVIRPGVYKEKLVLPASKTNVTFWGSSPEEVIVTFDDYASKLNRFGEEMGTTGSSGFFVFGDDFTARNITFENTSGPVGQAVAVRINGDRVVFENCRFLGFQDTLYPNGKESRQFYMNCYIEGTVDFIFGWSTVWFETCVIAPKSDGYITAASTEASSPHGFVFNKCRLDGNAPEHSVYLGRPWRDHAQTVFLNCYMDESIQPAGWHNWNKSHAEQTVLYAEFGSYGPGASEAQRVDWAKKLTEEEASEYTIENVLGGFDNWNPLERIVDINEDIN